MKQSPTPPCPTQCSRPQPPPLTLLATWPSSRCARRHRLAPPRRAPHLPGAEPSTRPKVANSPQFAGKENRPTPKAPKLKPSSQIPTPPRKATACLAVPQEDFRRLEPLLHPHIIHLPSEALPPRRSVHLLEPSRKHANDYCSLHGLVPHLHLPTETRLILLVRPYWTHTSPFQHTTLPSSKASLVDQRCLRRLPRLVVS